MKKQIFFVNARDFNQRLIPVKPKRSKAYKTLFRLAEARGWEVYWSSTKHFSNGAFNVSIALEGNHWKRIKKRIKPDFIVDKSYALTNVDVKREMELACPFMDPIQMQLLLNDKHLSALAFPDSMQSGILVKSNAQMDTALKKIKSKTVVVKPIASSGGRDVEIVSKSAAKKINIKSPMLVQEFIDSSKGVPGLYKGVHDFRLLFLGNKLIHAYIRTCVPGSKLCNVSLGGGRIIVPLKKVPKKMLEVSKKYQQRFAQFDNCFYSVDFLYKDGKKPIVIEANVKPGLASGDGLGEHHTILYKALLDHIEKFV